MGFIIRVHLHRLIASHSQSYPLPYISPKYSLSQGPPGLLHLPAWRRPSVVTCHLYSNDGRTHSSCQKLRADEGMQPYVNLETYRWGIDSLSNIRDGRMIISAVSDPDRRTMVSFLQLLVATDNYHTPHKYEFRQPKRWGPT